MTLPHRVTVTSLAIAMDGGTVFLECVDELANLHRVELVQHANPRRAHTPDSIPGRLYFDGELVVIRSDIEVGLLSLLRDAHSRERDELQATFIARIVDYVASEEYVQFSQRVERESGIVEDTTRYTVWIDCDAGTRNRTIVRLAQLEGIGLANAREQIEQQKPLAKDIPASEVTKVAEKYLRAGLELRVEPPFRWPLT